MRDAVSGTSHLLEPHSQVRFAVDEVRSVGPRLEENVDMNHDVVAIEEGLYAGNPGTMKTQKSSFTPPPLTTHRG